MKSEERHALQRNDLDNSLTTLPSLWTKHGNKILLVIAGAALVYFAVNYRHAQSVKRQAETQQALANAWAALGQIEMIAARPASPETDKLKSGLENDVNQSVETVITDSSVTPLQAGWAWLARGELYWSLATAAKAPTTAPASQPATQPAADPLGLAANAYNKIISDYPAAAEPVKLARFGLAAVAEDKGDVAGARTQYNALIETAGLPEGDVTLAKARLAKLNQIEKPTLLLPATQPMASRSETDLMMDDPRLSVGSGPTLPPASQPATTLPTTLPTSVDSAAKTQPATLPAR